MAGSNKDHPTTPTGHQDCPGNGTPNGCPAERSQLGLPAAPAQVSRPASVTCSVSDRWSAKIRGSTTPPGCRRWLEPPEFPEDLWQLCRDELTGVDVRIDGWDNRGRWFGVVIETRWLSPGDRVRA